MPDNQDVIESLENFSPATRAWFTAVFAAPTQAQAQAVCRDICRKRLSPHHPRS